jgi:hypothetical protein
MKLTIKETGESQELKYIWRNGVDCSEEMVLNATNATVSYCEDDETFHISQEEYEWWEEYFSLATADDEEQKELESIYGAEYVMETVGEALVGTDLDSEHSIRKEVFKQIRVECTLVD